MNVGYDASRNAIEAGLMMHWVAWLVGTAIGSLLPQCQTYALPQVEKPDLEVYKNNDERTHLYKLADDRGLTPSRRGIADVQSSLGLDHYLRTFNQQVAQSTVDPRDFQGCRGLSGDPTNADTRTNLMVWLSGFYNSRSGQNYGSWNDFMRALEGVCGERSDMLRLDEIIEMAWVQFIVKSNTLDYADESISLLTRAKIALDRTEKANDQETLNKLLVLYRELSAPRKFESDEISSHYDWATNAIHQRILEVNRAIKDSKNGPPLPVEPDWKRVQ